MPKRVLFIFPTTWDFKQLEACRSAWQDKFEIIFSEPLDHECRYDFDSTSYIKTILEKYQGKIDGIMSSSDYPGSLLAAILAEKLNLPGPNVNTLIQLSHKYYSRLLQQESVSEPTPWFQLIDPEKINDTLSTLTYPCFVKPVKGSFSLLSKQINTEDELLAFLSTDSVKEYLTYYLHLFNQLISKYPGLEKGASYFIAEELLQGQQATVEGYVDQHEITIIGIVDSILHPDKNSFVRFDFPSQLTVEIKERMVDITKRFVHHSGLRQSFFNVEMFYDSREDRISIIEINPRICGQFSDLYQKVTGIHSYEIALALSTGLPCPKPKFHPNVLASSMPLRVFKPVRVLRAPNDFEIKQMEVTHPDLLIWNECYSGDTLADFHLEDGSSQRYAVINFKVAHEQKQQSLIDTLLTQLDYQFSELE